MSGSPVVEENCRLDPEVEKNLWMSCVDGDEDAREKLILSYRPLVFWIARKFKVAPGLYADLVQEGMLALIKAVDRFEPERDLRFVTYGYYRIRGQMTNFLQRGEAKAPIPLDNDELESADPFDVDRTDWLLTLMDEVEKLPARECDVVKALVLEGVRAREYAEKLGVDVSHVYRIQRKAMRMLREILEFPDATEKP